LHFGALAVFNPFSVTKKRKMRSGQRDVIGCSKVPWQRVRVDLTTKKAMGGHQPCKNSITVGLEEWHAVGDHKSWEEFAKIDVLLELRPQQKGSKMAN